MWLIKLPFKFLAGLAVLVLSFFILVGNLMSNLASYLLGLILLFLLGCTVYCIAQAKWRDVAILTCVGFAAFLVLFLMTWLVVSAEQVREFLGGFIHS